MTIPPDVQAEIRRLYFQLKEVGYPDDIARTGCSIAVLVTSVTALANALDQLAADHFGSEIPPELTRLIGHGKAAADASYAVALGTLDLTPKGEDDPE